MKLIKPLPVPPNELTASDAVLINSNVPENDFPEWNNATNYSEGAKVIYLDGAVRRIYESLTSGNVGNQPDTSFAQWLDLGFVNRWRMFDGGTQTLTSQADSIQVEIQSNDRFIANALALFNVDAAEIILRAFLDSSMVFEQTIDLSIEISEANWFSYFFGQLDVVDPRRDLVTLAIPSIFGLRFEVEINRPEGIAEIGLLVFGRQQNLGISVYGSSVGIRDYSRKEVDAFGNFAVVERRFSKTATLDVILDTARVASIQRALASRRALPTVYVGSESACIECPDPIHEETLIYGYYRDFDIVLSDRNTSRAVIDLEGL